MRNKNIILARTEKDDLDQLFEFQLDKDGIYLAAFTPKDPGNKKAYIEKYTKHLSDPDINMQTIYVDGGMVGSIAKFVMDEEAEITYWINKAFWGQGIATTALAMFLENEGVRPIYGRVAYDNIGSQKVLEKNGFIKIGTNIGYANARQAEIEEYIYRLST